MNVFRSVAGRPRQPMVGRTDLIGGGLIAVSILFGGAHMLARPGPSPVPIPEPLETTQAISIEAATPLSVARLPRARPDEPVSTGSIGPRRERSPLAAESAAAPSQRQAAAANTIESLRSRAFLIASSSAECDHVVHSDVLQGGTPGDLVVSLRCNNGARFYLDRDAILANQIASPATSVPVLTEAEALRTCEDKLRAGLAVPPSLMRVTDSTGVEAISESSAVVRFDADALDGFGAPVFMHVRCEIRGREIARLDVQPR